MHAGWTLKAPNGRQGWSNDHLLIDYMIENFQTTIRWKDYLNNLYSTTNTEGVSLLSPWRTIDYISVFVLIKFKKKGFFLFFYRKNVKSVKKMQKKRSLVLFQQVTVTTVCTLCCLFCCDYYRKLHRQFLSPSHQQWISSFS